jgi:hypothetical protein
MSALVKALTEAARHLQANAAPRPEGGPELLPRRRAVLVTGIDRAVGAALATEFAGRGFTVHGGRQRPAAAARDVTAVRWHLVPRPDDPSYLPTLHRIVAYHRLDIVIPTLDEELAVLAGVRRWPDRDVLVVVSGAGPVRLAQDKLLTCWQLGTHSVPTPTCASPSDFRDTDEALRALGGGFVLRSRRTGGKSASARVVHTGDQLDWDRLDDDHIIQELVPGPEYLCCLYRPDGPAKRGIVVYEVQHPVHGPEGIRALLPGEAEDVERTSWAAIRALGILGPAELVLRRGDGGRAYVLSVHPRFSEHCGELLDQLSAPDELPRQRTSSEPGSGRAHHHGPRHRESGPPAAGGGRS